MASLPSMTVRREVRARGQRREGRDGSRREGERTATDVDLGSSLGDHLNVDATLGESGEHSTGDTDLEGRE